MTPRTPDPQHTTLEVPPIPDDPVGERIASVTVVELRGGTFTADSVASPMDFAPRFRHRRGAWYHLMEPVLVLVESTDGHTGVGRTAGGRASALVARALAQLIVGEDVGCIKTTWDLCRRATLPYGDGGLAAMARSAIDLALWDLGGKRVGQPVSALLGATRAIRPVAYASTADARAAVDLGFGAVKIPLPAGPWDGPGSVSRNLAVVDSARRIVSGELMVDAWMGWDAAYVRRIVPDLRAFELAWIEEPLPPFDASFNSLRRLMEPIPLAAGEHVQDVEPLASLALTVDVLQPDLEWCGGLTSILELLRQLRPMERRPTIAPHVGGHIWALHLAAAGLIDGPLECYLDEAGPRRLDRLLGWQVSASAGQLPAPREPGFGIHVAAESLMSVAEHMTTVTA